MQRGDRQSVNKKHCGRELCAAWLLPTATVVQKESPLKKGEVSLPVIWRAATLVSEEKQGKSRTLLHWGWAGQKEKEHKVEFLC